jgi:site-specific DNA recombinase
MWLACLRFLRYRSYGLAIRFVQDIQHINDPSAIETGVADLGDPALKERIAGLKAAHDQAHTDATRAQAALEGSTQQPVTSTMLRKFASTARDRIRIEGGGYRRDHIRALVQRVEVADREVRIMGSKSYLLRTLAAISGVKSATGGVRSSV